MRHNSNVSRAVIRTVLGAALATWSGAAFAGNLTPGGPSIVPTATTETGTLIASQTNAFTALGGTYGGSLYSAVFRETGGTLDFVYQVQNNAGSTDAIDRVSGGSFAKFDTSGYIDTTQSLPGDLGTGTVAPSFVFESLSGGVGYAFDNNSTFTLLPGMTSDLIVLTTNAKNFKVSTEGISGNTTVNVPTYTPAPVPESSTAVGFGALLALGLGGVAVRRRNRPLPSA